MDNDFQVLNSSEAIALLTLALVGGWDVPPKVIADSFLCLSESGEDIPSVLGSIREVRKALKIEPL